MFVYVVLNLSIIISVFCSFPLVYFVARNNLISTIKIIIKICNENCLRPNEFDDENRNEGNIQFLDENNGVQEEDRLFFLLSRIPQYLFVLFCGAFFNDLALVLNILGAIASNAICLLLPSSFYFLLIRKYVKPKKTTYYLAWAMFLFFSAFGIFAVYANIRIH